MYDILTDATASLSGRTLVNLSSDTPGRSREAATWAAATAPPSSPAAS
ncbi:hypothetical protein ACFQVA_26190 [Actinomadura keratinilytica]